MKKKIGYKLQCIFAAIPFLGLIIIQVMGYINLFTRKKKRWYGIIFGLIFYAMIMIPFIVIACLWPIIWKLENMSLKEMKTLAIVFGVGAIIWSWIVSYFMLFIERIFMKKIEKEENMQYLM